MFNIDKNKVDHLPMTNQMLGEKYGVHGTDSPNEFNEQSHRELREVLLENSKRNMSKLIACHLENN